MIVSNYSTFRALFATTTTRALDGFELWPSASLEASGFDDGFTGIDTPILSFPITISVDGLANGAEAYHLWLSQRTEVAADQYLSIALASGKSGSWTISLTSKCVSDLGLGGATSTVTPDQLVEILRNCHVYVQRISDNAIQWVDLLRSTLAG